MHAVLQSWRLVHRVVPSLVLQLVLTNWLLVANMSLVQCVGAAKVIACEWNPHAVEALHKNLELNGVADRCQVLAGDNTATVPKVRVVCAHCCTLPGMHVYKHSVIGLVKLLFLVAASR